MFVFYKYGSGLPDYTQLKQYEPPVVSRFYANDGRLFAEYAHEKRIFVPLKAIPKRITQTFLAAEDKNFYHHYGIDFVSILRSAIGNIKRIKDGRRPMGASTITQQVAKNFLLKEISTEISLDRKIKEAILSFRIERAYTKDHIFELYLNEIFLGNNSYGVASAALNYFNKSLNQLTIAEAAFLAALPKAPSRYNPRQHYELAKERRDWVIGRMLEDGLITKEEATKAIAEPIVVRDRGLSDVVDGSFFSEEVRRNLIAKFGDKVLYEGGLTVRTTLDPRLQRIAEKSLQNGLETYDKRHGWRGPVSKIELGDDWQTQLKHVPKAPGKGRFSQVVVLSTNKGSVEIGFENGEKGMVPLQEMRWANKFITPLSQGPAVSRVEDVVKKGDIILVEKAEGKSNEYKLCQIPKVSGALVAMNPHTGRVLAMVGGYSYNISQYNRATQAMRQTGSAFKPFVYLAALEKGVTPSTVIMDAPIAINMGWGLGIWRPKNFEDKFFGPTTVRVGFEKSRNAVSIRMTQERTGINQLIDVCKRFDITQNLPRQMATVLGSQEVTLLQMVTSIGMIANGGKKIKPIMIDRIQDRSGKTIVKADDRVCKNCTDQSNELMPPVITDQKEQVTDPVVAYQMTSLMQGVIHNKGTAQSVKKIFDYPSLAGKTGSTNDHKDAWFVGFSPDMVVGLYIGYDQPLTLGKKESGGKVAAPVFAHFMKDALKDVPPVPFKIPPGVRLVKVDHQSGVKTSGDGPNVIVEAFKVGTEAPVSASQFSTSNTSSEGTDDFNEQQNGEVLEIDNNVNRDDSLTGTGGMY